MLRPRSGVGMNRRRIGAAVSAAALATALMTAPAFADPKVSPGETATLDCGGGPMPIVVAGNGQWTPAHALNSNTVYQPVAFGGITSTYTVLDGDYAGQTGIGPSDPPATKGGKRTGQGTLECTFRIEGTFYEPNFAGNIHFVAVGTVWVKVTPA